MFSFSNKSLPFTEITPQEAAKKIEQDQPLLLDVREGYEYAQGHIPGTQLLPLGQLGANLNQLGDKDQEIIVVCQSGGRSAQASMQLAAAGYTKVYNLQGGTSGWIKAGLPVER